MRDNTFNVAKNPKYDGYQSRVVYMVYKFIDKKSAWLAQSGTLAKQHKPGSGIENEIMSNKKLTEELHKPIIKKFNERKVQSPIIDNICGADPADMQLIGKFNKRIAFYFVLLIFSVNTHGLLL